MVTSEEFAAVRRGFADYRLEEVIGEGAFGVVVSATQIRMDRRVAVKALRSEHAHQAEVRRRFAIEAQVLGRFQHPHIVDVYDYREGDDFCALVMERLEGGSLRQRLGGWPLRPETACAVALAVCSALEYAHGHDVLHRDIKPANLLFGRYGGLEALKLTDFGIAKVVSAADQPTQTGSFLGTASYMAPEQIEGRDPGPGVDIYGTAILLYQMLCDRLPFSTEGSAFAVAQRHLSSAPTPLSQVAPGVPAALAQVVMRGLAREPADRQQSAQELGVAIARVAHATFGPDWLEDGEVRLLAPGAILDAATGRTRPPRQTPPHDDPPTRIIRRPSVESGNETRVVSPSSAAAGGHEVEEEYDGVVFGDLERDPEPVDDTGGPSYSPAHVPEKPPPPPPPPPALQPWWRRWLTAGVVLLVVLVVVALLARACSSSADSGSSGSGSSGSSGTTATSATCWDGSSADSVADCSAPSGLDELAWMFPSIGDSCGQGGLAPDGLRQVVICRFEAAGDKGYIRYSNWHQRDDAINHYTKDFVADPGTWTLDGRDIGSLWVGDKPRPDVAYPFKAAGVYRDLPLSFSAYAHTRAGLQGALDDVVTPRPPNQLRGVSDDS